MEKGLTFWKKSGLELPRRWSLDQISLTFTQSALIQPA